MREKSFSLIKSCGPRTVPAAKTKSIGLPADSPPAGGTPTQLNRRAVIYKVLDTRQLD
jgi:hypothetical protein